MAAQAVFETYELLENILIRLPPVDVTRVMRMAKSWNQLIERSTTLYNSRILLPILPRKQPTDDNSKHENGIPRYPQSSELKFNPALKAQGLLYNWEQASSLWVHLRESLKSRDHEFVTFPPDQRIYLEVFYGTTRCTVYVKADVRIGDLLEVAESLVKTEKRGLEASVDRYRIGEITAARLAWCELGLRGRVEIDWK